MKEKELDPQNQEFTNETPEDTNPQSTIDTQTVTDESFDQTDKMAEECRAWQDKYVRLSAEFDNYRKRTLKEKMELVANGGQDVLKDVILIVDDLERALEHMTTEKEGIQLILNKFIDTLKAKGVRPIEALGKALDVDYHDAIAKVPANEETMKGKIIDVVQRGYMMGNKVLRFAKVVVGE